MDFPSGAVIGFFLGFAFGVGCALAVMYSIYRGGYRAAVRDLSAASPPERLAEAVSQETRDKAKTQAEVSGPRST